MNYGHKKELSVFSKLIIIGTLAVIAVIAVIAGAIGLAVANDKANSTEESSYSSGNLSDPDSTTESSPIPESSGSINTEDGTDTLGTTNENTATEAVTTEKIPETEPPKEPDKLIAFTFDDGPNAKNTPLVLDVLKKYNVHATFFVLGTNCKIKDAPDLLKRAIAEGHDVASHTYDHAQLKELTVAQLREQEEKAADAIYKACGVYPTMMRAPGGGYNDDVQKNINYPLIRWSVDTRDWSHRDPKQVLEAVKENATDGGIILMHDRLDMCAEATELCIKWLTENGYKIVSVSELMAAKGITLEKGNVYFSSNRIDVKP